MKRLMNSADTVVREMLEGVVSLGRDVAILDDENVVVRTDLGPRDHRNVTVLSGGGSGHEPAHAGYVGAGMLTAAIAGDVFTSPSVDAVLEAIRAVTGPAGAVLIVKNYTGDRLNFGLAAELARAEGIPVETVVVADDVALKDIVPRERRRGIAGTVLVHKIAGAAAEAGASLEEVARLARLAAEDVGSMGIALGACTLPAVGTPGFSLGENEIEVGLGIHGEKGVRRTPMTSVDRLAEQVLDTIIADRRLERGDRIVLLVNGLGATTPMELSILARDAINGLRRRGMEVARVWSGTFLSALDMQGFSLSVMAVNEGRLKLLDAATRAAAWPGLGEIGLQRPDARAHDQTAHSAPPVSSDIEPDAVGRQVRRAALAAADALDAAEPKLTELDSVAGDGDLGGSMKRAAEAIRVLPPTSFSSGAAGLSAIAAALRRAIGGSSGPFYAVALMRAARALSGLSSVTTTQWADAFVTAVDAVAELGGAQLGDRTMLDALRPAAEAFRSSARAGESGIEAWTAAVRAAEDGVEATRTMTPCLGRASYLGDRAKGHPDAGAAAVLEWMRALGAAMAYHSRTE
jgi:ATP-dependent dihydroxyacetone kinase